MSSSPEASLFVPKASSGLDEAHPMLERHLCLKLTTVDVGYVYRSPSRQPLG